MSEKILIETLTHSDNLEDMKEIKVRLFKGTDIVHGEFNYRSEKYYLLQMWISPTPNQQLNDLF